MKQVVYKVKVGLKGITPLLMHKCGLIEKNKKKNDKTDYSEEWRKTIYVSMNDSQRIIIPSLNLSAMMQDAAPGIKLGKKALSKIISPGTDIVEYENDLIFNNKVIVIEDIIKNEWFFSCAVRIKKDRVTRIRVCFPIGWEINFNVKVFNPLIDQETLRELFEKAGDQEGLMDWRPGSDKPGKFGQFEVVKFDIC